MCKKKKENKKTSKFIEFLLENKNVTVIRTIKKLYGINKNSKKINRLLGLSKNIKIHQLKEHHFFIIEKYIKKNIPKSKAVFLRKKKQYFSDLLGINHYKSTRIYKGLPIRGQRTHSNAKTSRRVNFIWIKKK